MIKVLQKKFVITAMIAITVLMVLMLGAINIVNINLVDNEMTSTLAKISENQGDFDNAPMRPEQDSPDSLFGMPKNEPDMIMSSNFFVVIVDNDSNVVFVDVSRTSSVTQEQAEEMAAEVLQSSSLTGTNGRYRYQIRDERMEDGKVVVFLDASEEILSYIRVLILSVLIGLVCWIAMLFLVILLSKKAIRPIAENIEKQKQFVTDAGHEIKTPLAIILANTDALELYNGESKWSKNIREQIIRLNGLTKNLLMLARMDEGMPSGPASEFSLSEMLTESVQEFAESLKMKQIKLEKQIQQNIVVCMDKDNIKRLISILLDNAVKYTNNQGKIIVRLHKNDKRIKLQVENTCEALPDAAPDKLFERFYRADKARTQKSGGYGIGLSVAESIVQSNKGSLSAEYKNENVVIFTVRF